MLNKVAFYGEPGVYRDVQTLTKIFETCVEVSTDFSKNWRDLKPIVEFVAIILGEKSRVVPLPDRELFVHFMRVIRANPDAMKEKDRILTALLLVAGPVILSENCAWYDVNDKLVIRCLTKIFDIEDTRSYQDYDCTLTVDANQEYTLDCQGV